MREKLVAIAPFLRSCPQLVTLGIRPSMGDYTTRQRGMLLSASQIFFPTPRFVRILQGREKNISQRFRVQRSKIQADTGSFVSVSQMSSPVHAHLLRTPKKLDRRRFFFSVSSNGSEDG